MSIFFNMKKYFRAPICSYASAGASSVTPLPPHARQDMP